MKMTKILMQKTRVKGGEGGQPIIARQPVELDGRTVELGLIDSIFNKPM